MGDLTFLAVLFAIPVLAVAVTWFGIWWVYGRGDQEGGNERG